MEFHSWIFLFKTIPVLATYKTNMYDMNIFLFAGYSLFPYPLVNRILENSENNILISILFQLMKTASFHASFG